MICRKRFPFRSLILPFVALVALASCGGDNGGTSPVPEEPLFPDGFASSFTEVRDLRASTPHGPRIRVYANSVGAADYTAANYPLPEGTLLVKEIYSDPGGTAVLGWVAMEKRAAGTAPGTGDWFWQEVGSDRMVTQSGQVASCIACHSSLCPTTDFVCTDP